MFKRYALILATLTPILWLIGQIRLPGLISGRFSNTDLTHLTVLPFALICAAGIAYLLTSLSRHGIRAAIAMPTLTDGAGAFALALFTPIALFYWIPIAPVLVLLTPELSWMFAAFLGIFTAVILAWIPVVKILRVSLHYPVTRVATGIGLLASVYSGYVLIAGTNQILSY